LSKGYTISYFINVFKNTTKRNFTTMGAYDLVSPRFGWMSEKAYALDSWLRYRTSDIVRGDGNFASFGKTSRARLLTALKNRKQNGYI
jgi:hypothetical protein